MPTPQALVEQALAASRSDDCVAILRERTTANLRWAGNTVTTNGEMHEVTLSVVAFARTAAGVRVGSVTGSATTTEQVLALVEAADAEARDAMPAEDAAELVAGDAAEDWTEPPEATSIAVYADVAPRLGDTFGRASAEQRLLYGFVDHEIVTTYLGSSTGLRLRHVQPTGHYGCTAKPADLSQSVWVGGATRDFTDVDVPALEAELLRRLAWGRRRVDLPAGRYDTVLPPSAVADLMVDVYWYADAQAALDGQSVYSGPGGGTRLGEQLARPGVRLWSDPRAPGLACAPALVTASSGTTSSVFDNGLPLTSTDWLRDGRLASLITTRHTAALLDRPVTPPIDNLALEIDGGAGGLEDLVAGVERGLLLTCLWYIRAVDPQTLLLTGLTRDGVYLVEDGEVTAAVNNFRWNESPVDLLRRFSGASATERSFGREWGDYVSRTATPALRVPDFNMSTVSQAL